MADLDAVTARDLRVSSDGRRIYFACPCCNKRMRPKSLVFHKKHCYRAFDRRQFGTTSGSGRF